MCSRDRWRDGEVQRASQRELALKPLTPPPNRARTSPCAPPVETDGAQLNSRDRWRDAEEQRLRQRELAANRPTVSRAMGLQQPLRNRRLEKRTGRIV